MVANTRGSTTSRTASLQVTPIILSNPVSSVTSVGVPATFSLQAAGPSLGYAWSVNGVAVPGANAPGFTYTPQQRDAGATLTIQCQVRGGGGHRLSSAACAVY